MSEFTESITISASPEQVWAVLADIGSISVWNPGVEHSEQTNTGDVEVGATRRCELGGKNYLDEEVVVFEPHRRITIRITDTNLPFDSADIRFSLEPHGGDHRDSIRRLSAQIRFGWAYPRQIDGPCSISQRHAGAVARTKDSCGDQGRKLTMRSSGPDKLGGFVYKFGWRAAHRYR